MTAPILILGAGAQGRVVLDVLRSNSDCPPVFFADANAALKGASINGCEVVGDLAAALAALPDVRVVIAMGNNPLRRARGQELKRAGVPLFNAIHAGAMISADATIGEGVTVGAGAIINTGARADDFTIINNAALLEHDSILEEAANLSPASVVGGRCHIGAEAFVGLGAIIAPRTVLGERSVVGAGSLVVARVPARMMVWGSPARRWRKVDDSFDWADLG